MRFGLIVSQTFIGTIVSLLVSHKAVEANVPHVRLLPVQHVDNNVFHVLHNGQALTYYQKYFLSDPLRRMGQSDPYQQQHANWMSSQQQQALPVWFDHQVFHVAEPVNYEQVQMTMRPDSRLKKRNSQTVKHFHDIFTRFAEPHKVAFGHIEQGPELFEQRFESLNKGNRYKGDIKWYDPAGGYGESHWNLAQGKL